MKDPLRIGILGASFNPVHIGHLRLALEMRELLALDQVDLLPCALPPHKAATGILPFTMRVHLLREAVRGLAGLRINPLEGERAGPSYTWDSLQEYAARLPETRRFFMLGCEDFCTLPQWRRGLELPRLADFVVVPRDGAGEECFRQAVRQNWPDAVPRPPDPALPGSASVCRDTASGFVSLSENSPSSSDSKRKHSLKLGDYPLLIRDAAFTLPDGARLYYLPLPRLDVSASLLRRRFMAGLNVQFLLPRASLEYLEAERSVVEAYWGAAR